VILYKNRFALAVLNSRVIYRSRLLSPLVITVLPLMSENQSNVGIVNIHIAFR